MKLRYIGTLLVPVITGLTLSCSNLLDIRDSDFIGGDIALQTVADNESLLMGAYAGLQSGTPPTTDPATTTDYEMNIRYNGISSDELKNEEFPAFSGMHQWTFGFDNVELRGDFMPNVTYGRVIDRVNRVLFALPNATAATPAEEAKRSIIRGEALFLRAFSHFEMFRYFSKPYDPSGLAMTYVELPQLDPQERHARIEMGPYFEKINRDIEEAKALLANNLDDKARANRISASALQARIALYTRNWNDAITYSTEYINAIPLSPRDQFAGIWTDQNTNEVSWRLIRTTANRIGNFFNSTSVTSGGRTTIGTVTWTPSSKLWNSFDQTNDIRFSTYFVDEPLLSSNGRPSRILKKYHGTGYATNNENVANIKVFRTAEMYLIRAEARAESGDLAGAAADLNDLRDARISNYTLVTLSSRDQAITEILQERFKELALEGHRFWDLKRQGLPVERLAADAPTTESRVLPANNFRFTLPIPRWEMEANELMVQNDGYTGN